MGEESTEYLWARVRQVLVDREQLAPGHPTPREIAEFADARRGDDAVSRFVNDFYYPTRYGGHAKLSAASAEDLVRSIERSGTPSGQEHSVPRAPQGAGEHAESKLPGGGDSDRKPLTGQTPGAPPPAVSPRRPRRALWIGLATVAAATVIGLLAWQSRARGETAVDLSSARFTLGVLSDNGRTLEESGWNLSNADVESVTRAQTEFGTRVTFHLSATGAAKLRALTKANADRFLAFVVDGGVVRSMRITGQIGEAAESTFPDVAEADAFFGALRSGIPVGGIQPIPLPTPEKLLLHQFDSGKWAAVIGEHPDAMTLVIRTSAEWADFCSRYAFSSPEPFDESKHIAIVVAIGRRDDEGDTVIIHPPEVASDRWTIPYSIKHQDGTPSLGINTNPWTIAILQRTDAAIDFRRID